MTTAQRKTVAAPDVVKTDDLKGNILPDPEPASVKLKAPTGYVTTVSPEIVDALLESGYKRV